MLLMTRTSGCSISRIEYRNPNGGQIAREIGEDAMGIILPFRGSNSVNGWCFRL